MIGYDNSAEYNNLLNIDWQEWWEESCLIWDEPDSNKNKDNSKPDSLNNPKARKDSEADNRLHVRESDIDLDLDMDLDVGRGETEQPEEFLEGIAVNAKRKPDVEESQEAPVNKKQKLMEPIPSES